MTEANKSFECLDEAPSENWDKFGSDGSLGDAPFESPVDNFYMTDPISRASETMAECTRVVLGRDTSRTGTDG
jgi:NADH-quinone oxidoreductase subunit G